MSHSPPPGRPKARIPGPQQPPPPYPRIGAGLWKRCLGGGLALWALTAVLTYVTRNAALLPTLILLGGFLVPVVFVLWAYERHGRDLGVSAVLGCFLAGGVLGVPGAALMEPYLLHPSPELFLGIGLVEEAAKLGALVFALRRLPGIRGTRAGLVLGAAVGFGFAVPESCGYAFEAAFSTGVFDLRTLLETEILRGLLAPFGQGLWTAIAGGVLLSCRRPAGRFRLPRRCSPPGSVSPCCTPCGTPRTGSRCGWWPGSPEPGSSGSCSRRGTSCGPAPRRSTCSPCSPWPAWHWSRCSASSGRGRWPTGQDLGEIPPRGIVSGKWGPPWTPRDPDSPTRLDEENDMSAQTETPGSVTTVYKVSGMSCGHCEGSVSGELTQLPGVSSVKAVASTGEVTVVSAAPLDAEAVRAAVDEAGFELTGTV